MNDLSDFLRSIYGGGSHSGSHTLSEKKKRIILSKLNRDSMENLFEQNTKTYIDHEGPKVIETSAAYIAGCGHLIGLGEQNAPSGICSICKQLICSQCSSNRCKRCESIICQGCSSEIDDEVFCDRCRSSYLRKRYMSSIVRAIHNLLSKEF